jgi:hypothetical protein
MNNILNIKIPFLFCSMQRRAKGESIDNLVDIQ